MCKKRRESEIPDNFGEEDDVMESDEEEDKNLRRTYSGSGLIKQRSKRLVR